MAMAMSAPKPSRHAPGRGAAATHNQGRSSGMVLGLGSKGKKGSPVQFVFVIVIQEVKPWKVSSSSSSSRFMIQWQRGDRRSGQTKCIRPDRDNRLSFNESLKIPATLYKNSSSNSKTATAAAATFQKKCITFNIFEAQSDRNSPRGQPLGRAVVDLSEYAHRGGLVELEIPIAVARTDLGTPKLVCAISSDGSAISVTSSSKSSSSSTDAPPPPHQDIDKGSKHEALIAALASDDDDDIASFTDDDDDVESASSTPSTTNKAPVTPLVVVKDTSEMRNERVQRILSSVAVTSPAKTAAMAAASKRISSSRASSSSDFEASDDGNGATSIMLPAVSTTEVKKASPPQPAPVVVTTPPKPQSVVTPPVVVSTPTKPQALVTTPKPTESKLQDANVVLQAARTKFAETAGERTEKLDKKAVEEARLRASIAEAKAAAAEETARLLRLEIGNLEHELTDAAALEVGLYSVVAQHGNNPHKFHTAARRLARMYIYASKYCSQDKKARTARDCVTGLVRAARACGDNDVSRLTFWWSNVVALRGIICQALEHAESPTSTENPENHSSDWMETKTFTSTLERIESWIFGRIVESLWWQSLTPHMQKASDDSSTPPSPCSSEDVSVVTRLKKSVRGLLTTDIADSRQGSLSIEIWKSAFLDALRRLCPVRAGGHDCGCLKVATKLIIEQCVARLDVAMFNAILRDTSENTPTDPISDPFHELSVLPISPDGVSFTGGVQLKHVISSWSTWLHSQTATDGSTDIQEVIDKNSPYFTLLRAMGDLLMLPKDILMDKSVRKEVCPALSLLLIRRILSKFVPDEFSPDPVPPSLVAALNAEISMERQRVGEEDISSSTVVMASAPPVVYFPPSPSVFMADLSPDSKQLSRTSSILRKGHTSDDELEEIESPLFLLVDGGNGTTDQDDSALRVKDASAKRFQLLRQAYKQS